MTPYFRKINIKAALTAAFFLSIPFMQSCKRGDDVVGTDFLPEGDAYASIVEDSFTLRAYSIPEDSLKIDSLSTQILGAINDPEFGSSRASLYTQILLREINVDFGTSPTIDSVILSLQRDGSVNAYGNPNSSISIDLYRMNEIIEREEAYFSNYQPALGNQIGTWTGNLLSEDTVWFEEDGDLKWQINTLRIPLDNAFGEDFFNNGQFGSNEVFLQFLNGIALVPRTNGLSTGDGNIVGIEKESDNSKLIVYYNGGLRKEFDMNSESQNISTYQFDARPAAIQNQFDNRGTHFDEAYLQAMGGSKLRLEIPDLYKLVEDGNAIAINEARLTLTVKDGSATDDFPTPERLLLLQPDAEDSSNSFILDLIDVLVPPNSGWIGNTNYGGDYDSDTKTYTFRFNRHLQSLLDAYLSSGENSNRGFYVIVPSDNPITPSRLILDTDDMGLELKVTYTKL